MQWLELSLDTTGEAVDWVCTLLAGAEFEGEIQIRDYCSTNPDVEGSGLPWQFTICLYLPYQAGVRVQVESLTELLLPLHRIGLATELEASIVDGKIPTEKAIAQQKTKRIGNRFVILTPETSYLPQADELLICLRPHLAFGSGFHPATMLSLQLLEQYVVPGMQALDLGSGSGILSVAMAKLGAQVLAIDNDLVAVAATQDAVILNDVAQQVIVKVGSLGSGSYLGHWMGGSTENSIAQASTLQAEPVFDLIMANILARVHVALADDYRQALRARDRQKALLITSGFTVDDQPSVLDALARAGFQQVDQQQHHEWVALVHQLI
jgi:ribosomal protein L11 methyltransferase